MKISEYIAALDLIEYIHGDLEVETTDHNFERVTAQKPYVDHRLILVGRETKPRFLSGHFSVDIDARRGEKVCRV